MNLRIPGPTPVPPSVLQAMAKPMINHRGPEFAELIADVTARLKRLFQTQSDLFLLTGSGTGGMEASVVNVLSPGDRVVVVITGAFGERYVRIARAFGADLVPLEVPWGSAVDPDQLEATLKADGSIKAVLVTHNETSTGITNDLEAVAQVVHRYGPLLIVDAISSIGAIELPTDEWGCDVVVTCSQKSWMVPPGVAPVSVGPRAWEAHAKARMPRLYWDFTAAKNYLAIGQTPWTPVVSIFFALAESLRLVEQEGLENVIQRHKFLGQYTRQGLKAMGLELFPADERYASDVVTAVKNPPGANVKEMLRRLRVEHGVILAGGQAKLSDQIFRIAHLGYVCKEDIDQTLEAMRVVLPQVGFPLPKAQV